MNTVANTPLVLGTSLLLLLNVGIATAQMDETLSAVSLHPSGEQERNEVPPQGTMASGQSVPSSPVLPTPQDRRSLTHQQTLLSSKTLVGVVVNNTQGAKMGTVRDIMIDPTSGQAVYAVIDSSGSYGFGKQKSFAVPWHSLQVKLDQTEIVMQLEQDQLLRQAPVALSQR